MAEDKKKISNDFGAPIDDDQNTLTAVESVFRSTRTLLLVMIVLSICTCIQEAVGQETGLDDKILRYEATVKQKPNAPLGRNALHRRMSLQYHLLFLSVNTWQLPSHSEKDESRDLQKAP